MAKINRNETLKKLIEMQRDIQFESPEDESAASFFSEIEELIILIKTQFTQDDMLVYKADNIGLRSNLVYDIYSQIA